MQLINNNIKLINENSNFKEYYSFREDLDFNYSPEVQNLIELIKNQQNDNDIIDVNDIIIDTRTKKNNCLFKIINGIPEKIDEEDDSEDENNEDENNEDESNEEADEEEEIILKSDSEKISKQMFSKSEINEIDLIEINSIKIPEKLTFNSLIKYFEDCEICSLILPAYIYKVKQNNDQKEKENISNIFSLLVNTFLSLDKKDNNILCDYSNKFLFAFIIMMEKMFLVGYETEIIPLKNLKKIDKNELLFCMPKKEYKIPNNNFTINKNNKFKKKEKELEDNKLQIKNVFDENEYKQDLNDDLEENNEQNIIEKNNRLEEIQYFNQNIVLAPMKIGKIEKIELKFYFPPIVLFQIPKKVQKIYLNYDLDNNNLENKIKNKKSK